MLLSYLLVTKVRSLSKQATKSSAAPSGRRRRCRPFSSWQRRERSRRTMRSSILTGERCHGQAGQIRSKWTGSAADSGVYL